MCYVLLKEKLSLFTTRILPFHPVTASKCSGPTTLLTPDQTVRAEHCWAALRGRDCTSARYSSPGTQLWSVGQFQPSSKGFQLWRLTEHIWGLVEEVRTSCIQSTGWKMADSLGSVPLWATELSLVASHCAQAVVGDDIPWFWRVYSLQTWPQTNVFCYKK